jgi:hypothetical protein
VTSFRSVQIRWYSYDSRIKVTGSMRLGWTLGRTLGRYQRRYVNIGIVWSIASSSLLREYRHLRELVSKYSFFRFGVRLW